MPDRRTRQVIAMGGGGFSMEPDNPLLDQFVLDATGVEGRAPRVCFIPTASGDSDRYLFGFYSAFTKLGADPCHLTLFHRDVRDIRAHVMGCDAVYVGGGNTANMLALWRAHGVDTVLREAYEHGVVMAGISAGANCWFEGATTDSFGELAPLRDGMGFAPGTVSPHYDGEAARRPGYQRFVREGFGAGVGLDDGCAVHLVDNEVREYVTSRPAARAWSVQLESGDVVERELPVRYLG